MKDEERMTENTLNIESIRLREDQEKDRVTLCTHGKTTIC